MNMETTWFNPTHFKKIITKRQKIIDTPIYGYVLPHAGTKYTAQIIAHTLNIRDDNYKNIKRVLIFYYPSSVTEDIIDDETGKPYYHEYYFPWQSVKHVFMQTNPNMEFYGYNINDIKNKSAPKLGNIGIDTWIIISADFSHFLPMQNGVALENKCAMALQYKKWNWSNISQGVDDVKTFKYVFDLLGKNKILRWVGRKRSPGKQGVGYLTFLITDNYTVGCKIILHPYATQKDSLSSLCGVLNNNAILPDGMFVTCYDTQMNTRECLCKWFSQLQKTIKQIGMLERELIKEVLALGATTSRLTGGMYTNIPIANYTVTYLFKTNDKDNFFIRGWHGVQSSGAFYLPDVFLENTYETGKWILPTNNT